jgi:hypothetical protein
VTVTPNPAHSYVALYSDSLRLRGGVLAALSRVTRGLGKWLEAAEMLQDPGARARAELTSIYLADRIALAKNPDASTSYAIVCWMSDLNRLPVAQGKIPDTPREEYIALNRWTATDLGATVGDTLTLSYLVATADGGHETRTMPLPLVAIVDLAGPAADPMLTPPFEGITDAKTIEEWNPPFPVDLKRVTDRDEEYWEKHRTTPKAFVSRATAIRLWTGPLTVQDPQLNLHITSARVFPPEGESVAALAERLGTELSEHVWSREAGWKFEPVRERALAASAGSTDFGTLFLSMGFFLVLSGMGFAAMLLRLSIARRAGEMGMLEAVGIRGGRAARLVFAEGAALSLVGSIAGAPFGIAYAGGIIFLLRTWWQGAVASAPLWLHVGALWIVGGFVGGLATGLVASWWATRALRRRRTLGLLAGWQAGAARPPGRTAAKVAVTVAVILAGAAVVACVISVDAATRVAAFFGSGAALLIASLCAAYAVLARAARNRTRRLTRASLALGTAAMHRGRSLLAFGLLACATFVIVAVAANERDMSRIDPHDKSSGTGGFSLRAISALPLNGDLNTPAGRGKLGFPEEDEAVWQDVRVMPFLMSSGDDASCLNLARPQRPRILGVPDAMVGRGGFTVDTGGRELPQSAPSPWALLKKYESPDHWDRAAALLAGRVPAFGDAETLQWQMHVGLGDTLLVPASAAAPIGADNGRTVQIVGRLASSIFASELLISEEQFRHTFPSESAPRYYLIETPPGRADAVADSLRRTLGEYGLEVRPTVEILAELKGVQNAYLMTFLALGGLGVVLGTVGLVVVVLRNALERRGEFALMLASGFRRGDLARLLVVENAGLLVGGVVCGTASALVAVLPQLGAANAAINWPAILTLLAAILAVGLVSCIAAAAAAVRGPLIEALRSE